MVIQGPRPSSRAAGTRDTPLRTPAGAGQAVAELAILLPVLLLVLLGAVDLGRVFILTVSIQNAAREGAVFAAANPSCLTAAQCANPANATYVARQEVGGDPALSVSATCTPSCAASTTAGGARVTVNVSQGFDFLTPFLSDLLGGPLRPSASATAVIQ